jgi:hypothetical protein
MLHAEVASHKGDSFCCRYRTAVSRCRSAPKIPTPRTIKILAGKCLSIQRDLRIPSYPSLSRTCNITSTDDLSCLPRDHVVQIHSHVVIGSKPLSRSTTCLPTPSFETNFIFFRYCVWAKIFVHPIAEKMPYPQKSISELADLIASSTSKYNDYLVANGIALPTHAPSEKEIPPNVPDEIASFRQQAIEASHELHELLIGPMGVPFTAYARVSVSSTS